MDLVDRGTNVVYSWRVGGKSARAYLRNHPHQPLREKEKKGSSLAAIVDNSLGSETVIFRFAFFFSLRKCMSFIGNARKFLDTSLRRLWRLTL